MSDTSLDSVLELVSSQANILVATATGAVVKDFEAQYQKQDATLRNALSARNLKMPFPWRSLWEWQGYYKQHFPTYVERRAHIAKLSSLARNQLVEQSHLSTVALTSPRSTSTVVRIALEEAEREVTNGNPLAAVDRVHTAVHGHLKIICEQANIDVSDNSSMTDLMKRLKQEHPKFKTSGRNGAATTKIINAMSSILSELNTLRNNATLAHPNDNLLDKTDAVLAINAGRSVLSYVDSKVEES